MLESCRVGRLRVACALLAPVILLSGCERRVARTRPVTLQEVFVEDSVPERHGERVVVTATVLYSDPQWHLLVLRDSTQGAYLEPPANLDLRAGDQVQITGEITDPDHLLAQPEFVVVASGKMPVPTPLQSTSQLAEHPTDFVQMAATVRWTGIRDGRAMIEAKVGDARVTALVFPGTSEKLPRIGSEVKLSGVASAEQNSSGKFESWRFWIPGSQFIDVLKPGPQDPLALPLLGLSAIDDSSKGKLVHVAGRVSNNGSSVSDSRRTVNLDLRRPLRGDFASAEVVGFWSGSAIEDAVIRPTGALNPHPGDIRSLAELKHLSVAEASTRRPVSVRGVVTYLDPYWGLMFLQDRTAAAFVNVTGLDLRLKAGDLVDVAGVSGPGDYAPVIADPAVSFVGHGTLPPPIDLDANQSNMAVADSRWCTFHGVARSVRESDGHTSLKLGAGDTALNVVLPTLIDGQPYRDKDVSVTGALGIIFNERRQAVGHEIFVPAAEFIRVLGTGGNPNSESTIAMLRRYSPDFDEHHSVGLHGIVVLKNGPNSFFIQDGTAGVQVRSMQPLKLNPGDRVAVRGFLRPGEYSPAVEDAVVRREGTGPLPTPARVVARSGVEGSHDSEYVAMRGVLSAIRPSPNNLTLVLNDGGTYFDATGPAGPDLDTLRIGSDVEVRGIFHVVLDRTHVPFAVNGFVLEFDSPASLSVRRLGPWWDAEKVRWTLILFGLCAGGALLWASLLRRKVHAKTQQLQCSLDAQGKAQLFDRARNEILETIARNAPLPESMERLCLAIQEQIPGAVCAVLLPPDGKSFLNGKPAPVLIAPGLSDVGPQGGALETVLHETVTADSTHFLAVGSDLIQRMLDALRHAGLPLKSGKSLPVFSGSGTVVGMLLLFSPPDLALSSSTEQSTLQSASRLISLALDHWGMHAQLLHEARHDVLTGLPNRAVAEDRLEQALARAQRRNQTFAVFCIDLDGFKDVNDKLGHDAGDELLRAVALRLRSRIRHSDTLARMGGDEFLAIIDDCGSDDAAQSVGDSLIASLRDSIAIEGHKVVSSASIGIAMYPSDGQNASQLKRNADQAMYRAKNSGGGQAGFWSREPELNPKATHKAGQK